MSTLLIPYLHKHTLSLTEYRLQPIYRMPSPLESTPPLIPVLTSNDIPIPPPIKTDLDDLLATLFAPATPPASPLPFRSSSIFSHPSNPHPRVGSISTASSTDSDFGAFVSVPVSEDPLAPLSSRGASPSRSPAGHQPSASAGFFAEARASTERNQQGLLAELLEHEDDPMYWHERAPSPSPSPSPSASAVPSGTTTPQPPQPHPIPDSSADLLGSLVEPVQMVGSVSVAPRRPAPPSPIARSPSLPPSPSRPSPPILTRVQSTSTFSPASLPSRWMSSFLTYRGPPPSTAPPARLGPIRVEVAHGSPFAASPFVPASGAPGFGGDRAWNRGFDASNGAGSPERHGVQLLGRKESTCPVLSTLLADILRSNLPPRARLPRLWTLLFSIDQHGTSLHTLYARCSTHVGGALLVVRDADDQCFGVWVSDGIREGHGSYTGSGESFLWKVHGNGVRVFSWTGKNDYVAL
ncbi:TLD-domain-containing protein, partial [Russula earlei]